MRAGGRLAFGAARPTLTPSGVHTASTSAGEPPFRCVGGPQPPPVIPPLNRGFCQRRAEGTEGYVDPPVIHDDVVDADRLELAPQA